MDSENALNWASAHKLETSGILYGPYCIRKAQTDEEKKSAWRLRFEIFNEELGEGIPENKMIGMDVDEFDPHCDHLIIEIENKIVATIRLLQGSKRPQQGFYSGTEFNLKNWNLDFSKSVEMGRVCIHAEHRRRTTLMLLFWGLRNYVALKEARYLFGLASLIPMSNDDAEATFKAIEENQQTNLSYNIEPLEKNAFKGDPSKGRPQIPQLVSMYVDFGAKVISRPAYDPVFGCHDLLIFFDLAHLTIRGMDLINKFSKRANTYGET